VARAVQVDIDCEKPDLLASFWAAALDYRLFDPPSGHATWAEYSQSEAVEPGEAWSMIVDPEGRGPSVLFHRVPEPKVGKNRLHLDIFLAPGAPRSVTQPLVDAEARRLVDLGATFVRTSSEARDYYVVMQDPEGNEFCVC
jgi:Glyoxalase-like domain